MAIVKHQEDRKKEKLWDAFIEWSTRHPHFVLLGAAAFLCVFTALVASSPPSAPSSNSNKMQSKSSSSSMSLLDLNDISNLAIRSCPASDLDDKRSNKNNNKNNKDRVVLCTFAKNEEPYLDEWVDYHLALGFETIFLYDNTDTHELQQWAPKKGCRLQVIHLPGIGKQLNGFRRCAKNILQQDQVAKEQSNNGGHNNNINNRTTWVGFFDLDEFLVLRQHETVVDFVTDHRDRRGHVGGAIGINWIIMGTAGKLIYEPFPVTKRFQYRHVNDSQDNDYTNGKIKTIVQAQHAYIDKMDNTHMVKMHDGYYYQDTNGQTFTPPTNPNGPTDIAALYHYQPKSFKENIDERAQGRADKKLQHISNEHYLTKAMSFNAPNGSVFDDRAWSAVKKYLPHYAAYDVLAAKNYLDYRDDHMMPSSPIKQEP
jgi:Glycosyl transferase family 2